MSSEKISAAAPTGAEAPAEIPERWSAARKTELVVRLLRGEPLDAVARESQVPAHELEEWRRVFLDGGAEFEEADRPGGPRVEARAGEAPRYLVDQKLPVRLLSRHPGGSGRLLFGDAANP